MSKEEFIGKLQLCYIGDRNAFNEILEFVDKLNNENQMLFNEMIASDTKINKAIEYAELLNKRIPVPTLLEILGDNND